MPANFVYVFTFHVNRVTIAVNKYEHKHFMCHCFGKPSALADYILQSIFSEMALFMCLSFFKVHTDYSAVHRFEAK